MNQFFKFAAGSASAVVILLAIIVVPKESWDAAMIVALLLFSSSVALPLAAPQLLTGHGKTETGSIATIGLSGTVVIVYLILAFSAFLLAAYGISRTIVWAAIVVSAGWLIIGSLITRGSIHYLDRVFSENTSGQPTRSLIMAELSAIRSSCPAQFASDLDGLLEKLRFSASDISGTNSVENENILGLLRGELTASCKNSDPSAFQKVYSELEARLSVREAHLKAGRSKI